MKFFQGDAGLRVVLRGGYHLLDDVRDAHGHRPHCLVPQLCQDIEVVQGLDLLVPHIAEHAHAYHAACAHLHTKQTSPVT